jgi:hypothetical protein
MGKHIQDGMAIPNMTLVALATGVGTLSSNLTSYPTSGKSELLIRGFGRAAGVDARFPRLFGQEQQIIEIEFFDI